MTVYVGSEPAIKTPRNSPSYGLGCLSEQLAAVTGLGGALKTWVNQVPMSSPEVDAGRRQRDVSLNLWNVLAALGGIPTALDFNPFISIVTSHSFIKYLLYVEHVLRTKRIALT